MRLHWWFVPSRKDVWRNVKCQDQEKKYKRFSVLRCEYTPNSLTRMKISWKSFIKFSKWHGVEMLINRIVANFPLSLSRFWKLSCYNIVCFYPLLLNVYYSWSVYYGWRSLERILRWVYFLKASEKIFIKAEIKHNGILWNYILSKQKGLDVGWLHFASCQTSSYTVADFFIIIWAIISL